MISNIPLFGVFS